MSKYDSFFRPSRAVYKTPEFPNPYEEEDNREVKTVVSAKELAEQREKLEKSLKEYERRRNDLLKVLDDFKKKDDPELRLKAMQYENIVHKETMDPSVLRAMRGLTADRVNGYIAKLREIADTTIKRDEMLASWLEGREKEKVGELVNRYNLMRKVNLAMVEELRKFLGNDVLYEEMTDKLTNGFPPLSPEDVKDRQGIQSVIVELSRTMDKYKPQIDAARAFRHEQYAKAFYHAVGRAHDRFLPLLESNPAEFERKVAEMINLITEVDLKKAESGDRWTVTYEGLSFNVNRGGRGMYASLTGASEENLSRYAKLGEFLEKPRRGQKKTADRRPAESRKIETEL